jgi:hypothetical protein
MIAVEIPFFPFHVRFRGRTGRASRQSDFTMQNDATTRHPQDLIISALAEMVPSTAAEIAAATGLDPVTAEACLERLASSCRVMFNPLTKRYSLPRARPAVGLAA